MLWDITLRLSWARLMSFVLQFVQARYKTNRSFMTPPHPATINYITFRPNPFLKTSSLLLDVIRHSSIILISDMLYGT